MLSNLADRIVFATAVIAVIIIMSAIRLAIRLGGFA